MAGFPVPDLGRSRTEDWTIDGGHLAKRCQLFVIIALGESVLATGASFANAAHPGLTLWVAFVVVAVLALVNIFGIGHLPTR